ncbi:hypothetical protein JI667_22060, partial [Bacillus sp. NTK074B]|nr:hypothetical protein [Bacillus sp. NTK074B]
MEHRWLYRHASLPGLWMLVLVPVLTLTTVLGGMPGWAWWVILGLQAALLWAAFRLLQRPDVT